jgi:hypothetical protein
MSDLIVNTSRDPYTTANLKQLAVESLYSTVYLHPRTKLTEEPERFVMGVYLFKRVSDYLDLYLTLEDKSLQTFMSESLDAVFDDIQRIKRNDGKLFELILQDVVTYKYGRLDFREATATSLLEIFDIMNKKINNDFDLTDEVFTLNLFKVDFTTVISQSKITNLRRIFDEVLHPIVRYYKLLGSRSGTILEIEESLSNRDRNHQIGKSVLFKIEEIEIDDLYEDITTGKIKSIEYSSISKTEDGVRITIE